MTYISFLHILLADILTLSQCRDPFLNYTFHLELNILFQLSLQMKI